MAHQAGKIILVEMPRRHVRGLNLPTCWKVHWYHRHIGTVTLNRGRYYARSTSQGYDVEAQGFATRHEAVAHIRTFWHRALASLPAFLFLRPP